MTITDEDRAAAWSDKVCELVDAAFEKVSRNPSDYEEHLAYRLAILAAFNAGLEQAAVIAEGERSHHDSASLIDMSARQTCDEIAAAIRAEKEKKQ